LRPKAEGNISRNEDQKFTMMIDDASHYLFRYTSKPKRKKIKQKSFKPKSCADNIYRQCFPRGQHCVSVIDTWCDLDQSRAGILRWGRL